jgi:hypothetical protein
VRILLRIQIEVGSVELQSPRTIQVGVHLLETQQSLLLALDLRDKELLEFVLEAYFLAVQ